MNSNLKGLADQNIVRATRVHATWQQTSRLPRSSNKPMFFGQGSANPYAVITPSRRDDDLDWHLRESGFHLQGDAPAMLTEAPIAGPTLDNRWRLRAVTQTCELEGFVQVCADAYASLGLPPTFTPSYFTRPEARGAQLAKACTAGPGARQPCGHLAGHPHGRGRLPAAWLP